MLDVRNFPCPRTPMPAKTTRSFGESFAEDMFVVNPTTPAAIPAAFRALRSRNWRRFTSRLRNSSTSTKHLLHFPLARSELLNYFQSWIYSAQLTVYDYNRKYSILNPHLLVRSLISLTFYCPGSFPLFSSCVT